MISRSGARARAPTAAYDPRRRKGGWIARADRVSESTELPLEERGITRDRRVVVVYSRGEVRERETRKKVSPRLASIPHASSCAVARARVRRRGGKRTIGERERTQLSLFDVSLFVIALEGTPERRRRRDFVSLLRRPQSRRDHPLNLSILLSGGKETNQDFLSSGERTGRSPAPNPAVPPQGNVVFGRVRLSRGVASRPSPS